VLSKVAGIFNGNLNPMFNILSVSGNSVCGCVHG
jgi:hypothetical protein